MGLVVVVPTTEGAEAALMKAFSIQCLDMAVAETDVVLPSVPRLGGINNLVAQRVGFALDEVAIVDVQMRHAAGALGRSEEHTSELQSRRNLVCRLLLSKKKKTQHILRSAE